MHRKRARLHCQIGVDIAGWSAFWIKLQGADFSSYSQLVFDIKADPQKKVPGGVKIELKRTDGQEVLSYTHLKSQSIGKR